MDLGAGRLRSDQDVGRAQAGSEVQDACPETLLAGRTGGSFVPGVAQQHSLYALDGP